MLQNAPESPAATSASGGSSRLVAWMLMAIGAVTAAALWDSEREYNAVLSDVAREQGVIAAMAALDLRTHLDQVRRALARWAVDPTLPFDGPPGARAAVRDAANSVPKVGFPGEFALSVPLERGLVADVRLGATSLLGDLSTPAVESPGALRILLAPPGAPGLFDSHFSQVTSPPLRRAAERRAESLRLSRSEAADVGLMARTAMAGLAYVDSGDLGLWGVVAIGTAARQRDRESRAFWRFVLGVAAASTLVLAFGGAALRSQRRKLEAQREVAVAAILRDRDERLARAERIATMGTFAMGVVHEVASPLSVIVGRAEQLGSRPGIDQRSTNAARAIVQQVDRIQLVVRRFLDMARGGPPALARTRPGDVVRDVAASVEHRFRQAGVSLSFDAPSDLPDIHCDRALLDQALVNLALNACDACRSGGHVELRARGDHEGVVFVVSDDGVGIRPEDAARAAEPFFTTKPKGAGTGLGLAIASEIAKSHRGQLTIMQNESGGTRACIHIPLWGRIEGGHIAAS